MSSSSDKNISIDPQSNESTAKENQFLIVLKVSWKFYIQFRKFLVHSTDSYVYRNWAGMTSKISVKFHALVKVSYTELAEEQPLAH
jgi:hypothetical protein